MANPTAQVPSVAINYVDQTFYWPLVSGGTFAGFYQTGEMIGYNAAGYAQKFDDSAKLTFLGRVSDGYQVQVASGDAAGANRIRVERPYRIVMPKDSGTFTRATDIGKPVYAPDSGHASLSPGANGNVIGYLVDVEGVGMPDALTGAQGVIQPLAGDNINGYAPIAASTAAAGSTSANAGVLPATVGFWGVYQTTAADGTKGVRIAAGDKIHGKLLFIGNSAAAILKIYPPTGGNINGLGVDTAFSTISQKGAQIVCVDPTNNLWIAN